MYSGVPMPSVLYEKSERIVHLTLNRPDTRNALSADVIGELVAGLKRAHADDEVSVAIIAGAGKGFSSGGNLNEIKAMTTTDNLTMDELERWYTDGIQQIPLTIVDIDVVTIAAVHGHAIGAGCDLAAMCDLRIAAESASFAESFLRVGLIPGDGGAWFLPRIIGEARAKEMLFGANPIDASRALDWGLVSDVVPDAELPAAALAMARNIAGLPPQGVRKAKQLVRRSVTDSLAASLSMAAKMQAELQQLDDHLEAVNSILEKRQPQFTGK